MSDEKKDSGEDGFAFPNPMKMFGEMYNQTLKQTAEQWEETARNPMFLAAMANNVEQSMQMQRQLKEMFTSSLQSMNLPTKDELLLLAAKVEKLDQKIALIDRKLDEIIANSAKTKKRPEKND